MGHQKVSVIQIHAHKLSDGVVDPQYGVWVSWGDADMLSKTEHEIDRRIGAASAFMRVSHCPSICTSTLYYGREL